MDFALNEEQSRWQNEARHFAKEEQKGPGSNIQAVNRPLPRMSWGSGVRSNSN